MKKLNFSLCIPIYNAGSKWRDWIIAYKSQTLQADQVIVINSSSTDQTAVLAEQAGFFVHTIAKCDFNHGRTRNQAVRFCEKKTEIVVFLTQDAILASPTALEELLKPFHDEQVVAVCGRQLPHLDANILATHARLFNYPAESKIKSKADIPSLGIKTAFMSNSFSAYRKSVFDELGGFPENTILAEDMHLAARMILAGYKVIYSAEAKVYHSHNYSLIEEFKRYFDIGVFQQKEHWIQEQFGKVSGEGKKFVISELRFLLKNNLLWIPKSLLSTLFKYLGFKLGRIWNKLPISVVKILSMHKGYWK
ncbi:glycosyltransferase family 2 protein [Bisgaard Taxon 10/6]|uniref:glycosyltransferase family 2 protein n=1 Tax=Exercitatus varius TaxID=67857 RepID=UPI00294AA309|nr:glycosyltransferase family 2 protein [Exercitatus varius]MDG2947549.1 glycosyltransferase family 2 protein [Exercitatus varius]